MISASAAQSQAADPSGSRWLSANAGSGKTRVLTDRVAWLLLTGVRPERILCLTYTKAAAAEMQLRLFRRLGAWSLMEEAGLIAALTGMGVPKDDLSAEVLARARTLFARAVETPGGLKIQTIHSFCAALLRRFPLEAGVSPAFVEIEERDQLLLADAVLADLADGPGLAAIEALAAHLSGSDMREMLRAVLTHRAAFDPPAQACDILAWLGMSEGVTAQTLIDQTFQGDEARLCRRVAGLIDPKKRGAAAKIALFQDFPWDAPSLADLARIEVPFLFGSGAKIDTARIGAFENAGLRKALGPDLAPLEAFMRRLEAARPVRRSLAAAERAIALHAFAGVFLPAFDIAKANRGWLDFADLIHRARTLLTEAEMAAWVLYRLDGGIDHLLVDEAQDTAPEQWQIIEALAAEFAAGLGARDDVARSLFVVGDRKQSIYSFQGADPDGFDRMGQEFARRFQAVGLPFGRHELRHSFRSAPPILELVDRVAAGPGGAGVGRDVSHEAFFDALPGRIDIWPVIAPAPAPEDPPWYDAVDRVAATHPSVQLAERIANEILGILADPPLIAPPGQGPRALEPGDILILVRSRGPLFRQIIARLKAHDLPCLGADQIVVTEQLAVKDITALLAFLATPEDDLALASILRSPLFGISEAELFDLAHGRNGYLWPALRAGVDRHQPTIAVLQDLLSQADFLRPFELIERLLVRHGGRAKLVARLGPECEDGIDALLGLALRYERTEVPSITGFLEWLAQDEVKIKRDPGTGSGQIRVMTVHGAKGLEAPLVILPDTGDRRQAAPPNAVSLVVAEKGPVLWPGSRADSPALLGALVDHAREKAAEEENRLLYVAITRAAHWLIVAAAGAAGEASWYGMIRAAAEGMEAAPLPAMPDGLRIETGAWLSAGREPAAPDIQRDPMPDWVNHPVPEAAAPRPVLAPSELGGAKVLPGDPGATDTYHALRRGRLIHLLLEHLPRIARAEWGDAAPGLLALDGPDTPVPALCDDVLNEAVRVLEAPELAGLFAPDALAEVALTGESVALGVRLSGQIDRLLVGSERVLAVDFKTNQKIPDRPEMVPEGLLRQMGAYAEMLAAIYPDRSIETAILWTAAPRLMRVPHGLVSAALSRAADP